MAGGHINTQGHLVHPSYSPTIPSRFDSPPPVLAPIQDERVRGSGERGQANGNGSSPYLHHPQPMGNEYQYHQNLGLSHGAWKAESGMRNKALVQ
jgi:zinc finger protein CreA/MIG